MRGVVITRHGPPSVLAVKELPDPVAGPNQIRISVHAAGLNFAEVSARQGLYPDAPKPPCVGGYEAAGIVDQVGAASSNLKVGDRVVAMSRFGAHADKLAVDEALVLRMPEKMSFAEGAAIPVNYLTAHHMLFQIGTVHPGASILIHMAAGGVGTAALQLLRTVPKLTIFGTASASKHEYLRALGCTHPIDYHQLDYVEEVKRLTSGRGVDIVLDALGGPEWKKSYDLLAPGGRLVAFGFANAQKGSTRSLLHVVAQAVRIPRFSPLAMLDHNRGVQGVNMGHLWNESSMLRPQLERISALYQEGVVKPHIHAEVPFSKAREAHEMIEQRKNLGKVVLVPDP
jgi:NADPH:quinone reductase-like Zn-dependent oxidoreductase